MKGAAFHVEILAEETVRALKPLGAVRAVARDVESERSRDWIGGQGRGLTQERGGRSPGWFFLFLFFFFGGLQKASLFLHPYVRVVNQLLGASQVQWQGGRKGTHDLIWFYRQTSIYPWCTGTTWAKWAFEVFGVQIPRPTVSVHSMVVVGKHLKPCCANCGLVVEIQIHLIAKT